MLHVLKLRVHVVYSKYSTLQLEAERGGADPLSGLGHDSTTSIA